MQPDGNVQAEQDDPITTGSKKPMNSNKKKVSVKGTSHDKITFYKSSTLLLSNPDITYLPRPPAAPNTSSPLTPNINYIFSRLILVETLWRIQCQLWEESARR